MKGGSSLLRDERSSRAEDFVARCNGKRDRLVRLAWLALVVLLTTAGSGLAQRLDKATTPAAPPSPVPPNPPTPGPTPAPAGNATGAIAVLGLRPLTTKTAAKDRSKLKRKAEQLRAAFEAGLARVTHQKVLGHSEMVVRLGHSYLANMFACAGELACLTKLAAPLAKEGQKSAMAGDYYFENNVYKLHVVRFSLETGTLEKETAFEIPRNAVDTPETWTNGLAPFVQAQVGKVEVSVTPADAICRIDGEACRFEADRKTILLTPGRHELEASKDGFKPATQAIVIHPGATEQVSITLTATAPTTATATAPTTTTTTGPATTTAPATTTTTAPQPGELRVPPVLGRSAPTLPVIRTESPPKIDGKLDDLAWGQSWIDPNFTQNFPDQGKAPTERTELRVLYDNEAVYVGIRCFDAEPNKISAALTRRDRDINHDKVTVDISSKNDRASSYHFEVTAGGVQIDGIRFNDTSYGSDWDGRWYSDVTRDAQGWAAELKIPLATLRYNGDVTSFGFQVRRSIPRRGEIDEWSYVPRTARGEVSYYGQINGMSGLRAKRLFEILLYGSRRLVFRNNQGTFDGDTEVTANGADVKVGLTSALTLNGTINPDFGTVEVDQTILNLSTVEAYFPEKRPFFLEAAEIYSTPFTLYYSRRIGARPPNPTLGDMATQTEPTPGQGRIWGAMNMSGLIGSRTTLGLLSAVTGNQDVRITRTPGGPVEKVRVDPTANVSVLRLRNEFGTNSSIGLLATSVYRFEDKGRAAPMPGDLCPVPYTTNFTSGRPPPPNNGRCTNDAYTAGIDGALRSKGGAYAVTGQVLGSAIENGPTRLIPDGTELGSGDKGWGMVLDLGRYGGDTHWLYSVHYKNSSPRLQINDAGYLGAANFHEWAGEIKWRTTEPGDTLLYGEVKFNMHHKRDWKLKDNLLFGPNLSPTFQFKNFWTINVSFQPYFIKYVENRETQDGARVQRNDGTFGFVSLSTNPAKRIVFSADGGYLIVFKDKYTGTGQRYYEVNQTLRLRPVPALELDLIASYTNVGDTERFIFAADNGDGTRTYLFNALDYQSISTTMRGTYTFTRKLTLQAYVQALLASGTFSKPVESVASGSNPLLTLASFKPSMTTPVDGFRDGTVNVNLFLRWEYLPLSAFWLVYTRTQDQKDYQPMLEGNPRLRFDRFGGGPATDVILAKLTYLWH